MLLCRFAVRTSPNAKSAGQLATGWLPVYMILWLYVVAEWWMPGQTLVVQWRRQFGVEKKSNNTVSQITIIAPFGYCTSIILALILIITIMLFVPAFSSCCKFIMIHDYLWLSTFLKTAVLISRISGYSRMILAAYATTEVRLKLWPSDFFSCCFTTGTRSISLRALEDVAGSPKHNAFVIFPWKKIEDCSTHAGASSSSVSDITGLWKLLEVVGLP